ncbi:NmrA family NAD(P)-binding protein [Agromyces aurantiacus]|uniref:NmrA family NAD(P)-binding protein n=1 Tax=Agromyces aurantiacus TaxID=165814 RepID=A0ABV9R605_9MICO|nr:NmrA family NAD(P)-binding protein [Agromyces aurantiacus]MBM7503669.1 uncharacterized protein YbjT (DUF2867 family) [Agromyces aurantiacus]
MTTTIAVIGATGKTGRRVAERLEQRGLDVRRLARGTSPTFDWDRPDGWRDALAGVDRAYAAYVPDLAAPGSDAAIRRLAETARDAGVRHLVLLSGRGEAAARRCEELLFASGLPATVVRASWFLQNFTEGMLRDAVDTGVLALPAGDVREPFVDVDDLADVVVEALTGTGHEGRVHEVTGPASLTMAEVAQLLTEAYGREVRYVAMGFDEFHGAVAAEAGPETATLLAELCREVFDGRNVRTTTGVLDALGRAPRAARTVFAEAARAEAAATAPR